MAASFHPASVDYWTLVDPVWNLINVYDTPRVFLSSFSTVRREIGHLYAAHFCQSEVCNGGFAQFFFNSTGVLAPEAIEGFRVLGLTDLAGVVAQAVAIFGAPYPRDRDVRDEALDQLPGDAFESLDKRFFELIDTEHGGFNSAADVYATAIAA